MTTPKTVTMQQVADAVGVSKMTVSRALKDHPYIAADTKERVLKAANEMGYNLHPYISALMSHRVSITSEENRVPLAVFHFDSVESTRRHHYFHGIEQQAFRLGYKPELFHYNPDKTSPARLRSILNARGIRGIILMPAQRSFEKLSFDFSGFSAIVLGHTIVEPQLPRVGSDVQAAVFTALDQLSKLGYRRIGLINTENVNKMSRYMYVAMLNAYKRYAGSKLYLPDLSIENNSDPAMTIQLRNWIEVKRLDAVVSACFDMDVVGLLRKSGYTIPEQLGYAHLLSHRDTSISQMKQPVELMGVKAVNQVTAAINQNDFNVTQTPYFIGLTPDWHAGKTLQPQLKDAKAARL